MSDIVLKKGFAQIARKQRAGRYAEALADVDTLLQVRPVNTRLLVLRGILIQLGEDEQGPELREAKRSFAEATQLDNRSPEPLVELGHYLLAVEDKPREALARFERAARLAGEFLNDSLEGMASCLLELGRSREARECLAKAASMKDKSRPHANGNARSDLGRQSKAAKRTPAVRGRR